MITEPLSATTLFDFSGFERDISQTRLAAWSSELQRRIRQRLQDNPHGKLDEWRENLRQLPQPHVSSVALNSNRVIAGSKDDLDKVQQTTLKKTLLRFAPWRKGPYELFGIHIDTEWRSDWKWQRLEPFITPLQDRLVLDVGCGNGYHMWRMLGAGARIVAGVDPSQFFLTQFNIIKRFAGPELPVHLLPLRGEDLPDFKNQGFDTVFSMGVLYHRRSPFNHLQELKSFLRPGGELVLETLVIEGDEHTLLFPRERYAKMRNVWFIPSPAMLELWLKRLGFRDVHTVDISRTTSAEQRVTEWMTFESLADFLDPDDPSKTIEGYPAPVRACIVCKL